MREVITYEKLWRRLERSGWNICRGASIGYPMIIGTRKDSTFYAHLAVKPLYTLVVSGQRDREYTNLKTFSLALGAVNDFHGITRGPGDAPNTVWFYADDFHNLRDKDPDKRYSAVGITKYQTHWLIHNMFVVEKYRGKGIGSALLKDAIAAWKSSKAGRKLPLMLEAQPYDLETSEVAIAALRRFYTDHGFRAYRGHPYSMFQITKCADSFYQLL